jgi:hypothetical protein
MQIGFKLSKRTSRPEPLSAMLVRKIGIQPQNAERPSVIAPSDLLIRCNFSMTDDVPRGFTKHNVALMPLS